VGDRTYRIGLIGAGIIAASHVPALRAVGLEVTGVGARPGSKHVEDFAATHAIARVFDSWQSMLAQPDQWDALVVTTWPDGTPEILEAAMPLNLPILVEKPVAWNSVRYRPLLAQPHDHVIVGYNRRFYPMVQAARQEVENGPPLIAQLTLPTNVLLLDEPDPSGRYMQEFYESVSALGIDLTRYILGDLKVDYVKRLMSPAGNVTGLAAVLSTDRGDIVQLTCNWNTSANYALSLNRPKRRFELLPFEVGNIYEGMEVQPPSDDYPIRRYLPKPVERINLVGDDLQYKPGFVGQAQALRTMIEGGQPPAFAARLEDALAVTHLCEELTGVVLGDTNPSRYHH
jgi:predicted dehydrogenase